MRLLFQNPDIPTLLLWVSQQWVYIGLAAASVLLCVIMRFGSRIAPRWINEGILPPVSRIVALITWFYSFLRLDYGPTGNVFSTLLPYGLFASFTGAAAIFVLVLIALLNDAQLNLLFRSVLNPGVLSRNPSMRGLLDAISIPDEATCKTAFSLAKDSASHLKAAKLLYRKGTYGESISWLQQAVETSTKSMGLLLGTIPNDADVIEKEVGHHATKALLLGITGLRSMVANVKQVLSQIKTADNVPSEFLKGPFRRFDKKLADFGNDPLPPIDNLVREAQEVIDLKDRDMWEPTLLLDRSNKWVDLAIRGLETIPVVGGIARSASEFASATLSVARLFGEADSKKIRFVNSMNEAFRGTLWLSLLLDWHFIPSRYSPIRPNSYWRADVYTSKQPLVREAPRLFLYAQHLSRGVFDAAKAALEYHNALKHAPSI